MRNILVLAAWVPGLLLSGCGSSSESTYECYFTSRYALRSLPVFETYFMNVESKGKSRIDIYFRMPLSRLKFARDAGEYRASYAVSFVLRNDADVTIASKDVRRPVSAGTYDETRLLRDDAFLQTFVIDSGAVTVEIAAIDEGSGLEFRSRRKIEARSFSGGNFGASNFLLLENARTDESGVSLRPVFLSNIARLRDTLGTFEEVYNVRESDTLEVTFSYATRRGPEVTRANALPMYPPYNMRWSPCAGGFDSVYFRKDSTFVVHERGTQRLFQFFPRPHAGITQLRKVVRRRRDGAVDSVTALSHTAIYTRSFPRVTDPDDLIEALRYIAREEEIDSLRAGANEAERAGRLAKFWQEHGGPARRAEYEERIKEANELFSACIEGWRTPMGITSIVCGLPDQVECQGAISEVWYYAIGNQVLAVPFRSDNRSEDELFFQMVPYSVNEYFWQYFVDKWRRKTN